MVDDCERKEWNRLAALDCVVGAGPRDDRYEESICIWDAGVYNLARTIGESYLTFFGS